MFIIYAMEKIEITVIGAGVIGLSIAAELAKVHKEIFVVEKNDSFGQETSSRNSEVIHAGIYYPKDSLKAKTCIEGRRLLYEFCARNNIPHKRIGKFIVAVDEREIEDLKNLYRQGIENGVEDLRLISRDEVKKKEPNVDALAAIYASCTGIVNSHRLMENLVNQFKSRNGQIAYNTEVTGIDKTKEGFIVKVQDKDREIFQFLSRIVINCAGLNSDKVAGMAGLIKDEYRIRYCKGSYFRVSQNKAKFIRHLIYPLPRKEGSGLGIHATLDLAGGLRLGPDDEYVNSIDYNIDISKQKIFYENIHKFLPFIQMEDINPDTVGIRPKLQGPKEGFRDFIIKEESGSGLGGFINLIGIESPGLTACLSIAQIVRRFLTIC